MAESELKARVKTLIGVALVGAVLLLSYEIFYWFTHVYESDVRVHTDFTDISSRVDGKIAEIEKPLLQTRTVQMCPVEMRTAEIDSLGLEVPGVRSREITGLQLCAFKETTVQTALYKAAELDV